MVSRQRSLHTTRNRSLAVAALLVAVLPIACQGPPLSGIFLPHHTLSRDEVLPTGLIAGTVEVDGGCLWLDEEASASRFLLLWPGDYDAVC